jgi:hypothetical protein
MGPDQTIWRTIIGFKRGDQFSDILKFLFLEKINPTVFYFWLFAQHCTSAEKHVQASTRTFFFCDVSVDVILKKQNIYFKLI